jgi:guanylate kinase
MIEIARRGVCLVLSAPSGAGKTAIADALVATEPMLERSISVTTRERRPTEIDGVHYHFLTEDRFQLALRNDALLEWARVLQGTHAYGTPRAPVEKALAEGRDVVFDVDWQGHRQLREKLPGDVVSVFVLPPNIMTLRSRLVGRAGDRGDEIERRMRVARDEIRHWVDFDHVVVNEDLPTATEAVRAVLHSGRSITSRMTGLRGFTSGLV